jgi:cytochrome c-type biogenesis protein CcmH
MTRRLALLPILLVLVVPAGASAMGAAGAAQPKVSLPTIERQVMCVTCKIPLDVAESPQADREKAFIERLVAAGESEAQIKRALVGQYGATVLGLPAAKGFDLTVYLVPLAAVLLLLGIFLTLLPRWRRAARRQAAAERGGPALAPADAARLNSDLARFD